MPHVFVSYVKEDAEVVLRLARDLAKYNVTIWLDREQLRPGQRWQQAVKKAIREGAFFLACFSDSYASRSKTYMNEELAVAIEELRLRPHESPWFIPIQLSHSKPPDLSIGPYETMRSIQWVSLADNWEEGLRALADTIAPTALRLEELVNQLQGSSARLRIRAIDELGLLRVDTERAILHLVRLLEADDNDTVRAAAADALGRIGVPKRKIIMSLLESAKPHNPEYLQYHAEKAIVGMGAGAAPVLVDALRERELEKYGVREVAGKSLTALGAEAVPALLDGLQHSDRRVRAGCFSALYWMGETGTNALLGLSEDLLPVLDEMIGVGPNVALLEIFPKAGLPAMKIAGRALNSDDTDVLHSALKIIALFGPSAGEYLDLVIQLLDFPGPNFPWIRIYAAKALGTIGEVSATSVLLTKWADARNKPSRPLKEALLVALGRMADPAATHTVFEYFCETGSWDAFKALGVAGSRASKYADRIVRELAMGKLHWLIGETFNKSYVEEIAEVLGEFCEVDQLQKLTSQGNKTLRIAAERATVLGHSRPPLGAVSAGGA